MEQKRLAYAQKKWQQRLIVLGEKQQEWQQGLEKLKEQQELQAWMTYLGATLPLTRSEEHTSELQSLYS